MERNSRIIRIILSISIIFTLLSCTTQQDSTPSSSSSISTTITTTTTNITTPIVTTTTTPVITTSITTTTPIITTKPVTTTTPIVTTIVEETGSMLAPVTSNYLISSIEEGYSFYAMLGTTQCPHCKAQKALLEDYLSSRPNITFFIVMLDADTSTRKAELVEHLDLYNIPLMIQVENGIVVNKYEGRMELEELERFMQ